ncbi:MAG: ribosome recycling factor [Planctomycetes bacterium RBG_16_59_8]|nr:MAG: ribosome recycling factor [Planctomycetes bacterium RBG_16_59_8]
MSDEILRTSREKMEKAIEVMLNEFKGVRTGRATPGLVENIRADYYGTPTPIKQLATITIPDAKMILIKPFDQGALAEIEKAIAKSDIGINPQSDGKVIRLTVPPLSEDRRRQMSVMVKDIGEKARVAVRNIRRDANKHIDDQEKEKAISKDDRFRLKDEIQKMTDGEEKRIGDSVEKKTKEIMTV